MAERLLFLLGRAGCMGTSSNTASRLQDVTGAGASATGILRATELKERMAPAREVDPTAGAAGHWAYRWNVGAAAAVNQGAGGGPGS